MTWEPPATTAPPINFKPKLFPLNITWFTPQTQTNPKLKKKKKKIYCRASCDPATIVHHGTTHHYPPIFLKPKLFQPSNITWFTPQTQTKPKYKKRKKKKKPYIHNSSSTKLTLQPSSPLIVTSNRHLQFIVIHNPTTKLLTTEYDVRFVVKSALKAFWWRSCWSRVWNFSFELETEIFFGREGERDFLVWFVKKREKKIWFTI